MVSKNCCSSLHREIFSNLSFSSQLAELLRHLGANAARSAVARYLSVGGFLQRFNQAEPNNCPARLPRQQNWLASVTRPASLRMVQQSARDVQ